MRRRDNKILLLAALFVASSATFLMLHPDFISKYTAGAKSSASPVGFQAFRFDPAGSHSLDVSGFCKDFYYTLLLYAGKVDFRSNPAGFAVNIASPCNGKADFTTTIDISRYNLIAGADYYLVRAHQGKTGTWHDPY